MAHSAIRLLDAVQFLLEEELTPQQIAYRLQVSEPNVHLVIRQNHLYHRKPLPLEPLPRPSRPKLNLEDLRVGLVSTRLGGACGLAVYAEELAEELKKIVKDLKVFGIPIQGIEPTESPYYNKLSDEIDKSNRNLVHILQHAGTFKVYLDLRSFVGRLVKKGIRVVISATSPYHTTVKAGVAEISKIADLTLVHTRRDYNYFISRAHGRLEVIEHGIKLFDDEPVKEARARYNIKGRPVIATHGMFAPSYKGTDILIDAVKILKAKYPKVKLLMVCSAARYPITFYDAEAQVNHLKLNDNVEFFTEFMPMKDVMGLLHCADIISFPYRGYFRDTSGAFRRGLAARRPVIVSDAPMFDPNLPLIKVPQNNAQALAEAIDQLYTNRKKSREYVRKLSRFTKKLSWANIAERLVNLYLSV